MGVWRYVAALVAARGVEAEPVTCWGLNDHGLATPPELGDVIVANVGYQHACALKSSGEIACWGDDTHGQATVPDGLTSIVGVVAGGFHTCVWDDVGAVTCWGSNEEGQTSIPSGVGTVVGVTAGWKNTCSWNTAGTATCWGENRAGEIDVPEDLTNVQGVALGLGRHACAWDSDGRAPRCWGDSTYGQATPPTVNKNGFFGIAIGGNHTCGVRKNGKIKCWGDHSQRQLNIPGFFSSGINVAAGATHSCGGRSGIMCWGNQEHEESVVPKALQSQPTMFVTSFYRTTCGYQEVFTTTTTTATTTATTSTFSTITYTSITTSISTSTASTASSTTTTTTTLTASSTTTTTATTTTTSTTTSTFTTATTMTTTSTTSSTSTTTATTTTTSTHSTSTTTSTTTTTTSTASSTTTTTTTSSTHSTSTTTSITTTTTLTTSSTTTDSTSTTTSTTTTTTSTASSTTTTTATATTSSTHSTSTTTSITTTTTSTASTTTVTTATTTTSSTHSTSTTTSISTTKSSTASSTTTTTTTTTTSSTHSTSATTSATTTTTSTATSTTTVSSTATTATATTTTITYTGSTSTATTLTWTATTLTTTVTSSTATATTTLTGTTTTGTTSTTLTTMTATTTLTSTTTTRSTTSTSSSSTSSTGTATTGSATATTSSTSTINTRSSTSSSSSTSTTSVSATSTSTTTASATTTQTPATVTSIASSSTTTTSTSSTTTSSTLRSSTTTSTVTATSVKTTSSTTTSMSSTATSTSSSTSSLSTATPVAENSAPAVIYVVVTTDPNDGFFVRLESDLQISNSQAVNLARMQPIRLVDHTWVGLTEAVTVKPENLTMDGAYVNIGNAALAPVEALRPHVADGDDVVIVVTRVSNPDYLLEKVAESGEDLGEIHGMVVITLYNRRTGEVIQDDKQLDHSILMKVSDDSEPSGRVDGGCVFVDGETWSTEGMSKAEGPEIELSSQNALERSALVDVKDSTLVHADKLTTSGLWCATRSFGINAFLLGQPLMCASASTAGHGDDPSGDDDDHWITSRPALLYFALLLFLGCCHIYGVRADGRYRKMDMWSDRCLDTIMAQLTPEVHARCCNATNNNNNNKLGLQEDEKAVTVVPFYSFVSIAFLIRCRLVTERYSVPLQGLPSEVLRYSFGPWGFNHRCGIIFRAFHSLLTLGDPPFMLSCVKNAKLMTDSVLFPLCVLCLVFSASGEMLAAGSDRECVPRSFDGGWAFFISGFCAFLCGLPVWFQAIFFARRDPERRSSCRTNTCFWVLEVLWTMVHLVITLLFLSNVAPVDRWKWEVLLVLVLLFVFLLKPLLIAIFLAIWMGIVVRLWPAVLREPTPQEQEVNRTGNDELACLDQDQRATVRDLAHRGVSLSHLLDFYQKLGTVVMPQYDPQLATTEDVVRQAIIPLSLDNASELHGQPMKVKLGTLHLLETHGRVCDLFVRCEVLHRPNALLETWAVSSSEGLQEMDWCMEAELLGYQPGDCLELSLIESDTGRKVCSGRLRSRLLSGQHEVPLINSSNARLAIINLEISPLVNTAAPVVPRSPVAPPAYQRQGYSEWCGADVGEHPAIPELSWVVPLHQVDKRRKRLELGDVHVNFTNNSKSMDAVEGVFKPPRIRQVLGRSYASAVNVPVLPGKMVTHHWGSLFTHLMAGVIADALGQETYVQLLPMLETRDISKLRSMLGAAGKLDESYWIDAFSVNQHMSVCSNPLRNVDSMGMRISPCTCATRKIADGPLCEHNKMRYVMAYLNALVAEQDGEFEQVVVVDPVHSVFRRTWCIAELHEADQGNMAQAFVLHSFDALDAQVTRSVVDGIDIRTSKISYEEDRRHLLGKIDDADAYNECVRNRVNASLKSTNAIPAEKTSLTMYLLDVLLI